jgi:hypothetical protein
MRNARSAFSIPAGSGIVYFGFARKPFGAPNVAMALSTPWEMAARKPADASFEDTASNEAADANVQTPTIKATQVTRSATGNMHAAANTARRRAQRASIDNMATSRRFRRTHRKPKLNFFSSIRQIGPQHSENFPVSLDGACINMQNYVLFMRLIMHDAERFPTT